ncbi:NINE protein [Oceanobacillus sp. CAU 1775]
MYQKNIVIAYILWIIFGHFGLHRMYTGRIFTGIMMLLLGVIGWGTAWIFIGYIPLIFLWIWMFIDIFLIPGMCRNPR